MSETPATTASPSFASIEERNAWLRERIDPQNTLPVVSFGEPYEDHYYSGPLTPIQATSHAWRRSRNSEIGALQLYKCGSAAYLGWISLCDPGLRGRGYGTATYLKIMQELQLDMGMESDAALSAQSYGLWRRLESLGVATSNVSDAAYRATHPNLEATDILAGNMLTGAHFRTVFGFDQLHQ